MKPLVKMIFGSHLYGTSTPQSDTDHKGVFMPQDHEILLGRIPRTLESTPRDNTKKNGPGDLDEEYYSLHHFVKLACQGQTVTMDMLHAPKSMILETSPIWEDLIKNRSKFYSRDMHAFVGYCRAQAYKYSLKGERLAKLREFADILANNDDQILMREIWNQLPRDDERIGVNCKELQIASKWFGETTRIGVVLDSVTRQVDRYGKRAAKAADASGADWKALSHAVRVAHESIYLLRDGGIEFPLPCAPLLLKIKLGEIALPQVSEIIDELVGYVEELQEQSSLPKKPDYAFWDNWLCRQTRKHLVL